MEQRTPDITDQGSQHPARSPGNGRSADALPGAGQGSLIRQLMGARYWVGLVALVTGALIATVYAMKPVLFGSTVVMYLAETSGRNSDGTTSIPDRSPKLDHLHYAAISTEMLEHLIQTYDLYGHYDIDTLQPLYHERMCAELLENISVRVMDANAMSITVKDRDRSMAAQLANNLFNELQAMTERHALAYSQRVAAFYREVIQATEQQSGQQIAVLMDLAGQLKAQAGRNSSGQNTGSMEVLDLRLADMLGHVTSANEKLLQLGKELEISTALLQKENLPNMLLMQRGMEDMRTRPWLSMLGGIIGGMFIATVLSASALILWFKHGHEFLEYFTEEPVAESGA